MSPWLTIPVIAIGFCIIAVLPLRIVGDLAGLERVAIRHALFRKLIPERMKAPLRERATNAIEQTSRKLSILDDEPPQRRYTASGTDFYTFAHGLHREARNHLERERFRQARDLSRRAEFLADYLLSHDKPSN